MTEHFTLPGDAGFPLGGVLIPPNDREEAEMFRAYLRRVRDITKVFPVAVPVTAQSATGTQIDRCELFFTCLSFLRHPQARSAAAERLIERCYLRDGTQNKFWFAFAKRRFLNFGASNGDSGLH